MNSDDYFKVDKVNCLHVLTFNLQEKHFFTLDFNIQQLLK